MMHGPTNIKHQKRSCVHLQSIGIWRQPTTRQHDVMSQNKVIFISFLVPGAVIRPKYGSCSSDQIQERRHSIAGTHRAERGTATLDFMRKFVSQMRVHVPASQIVLNELCRNHSNIFLDRVRHFDMWALKSKHFIRCIYRPTR